ncbi:hypothetical protein Vadar_029627 [Vaccinium darrowii]|uniref:Uncharacterized protein n=1 Tax=Vaccinium darrowii TaxID=229202 RepID=A0ACB7XDR7_9ERIC|nr:hypothetical protein Vadar_029627 [Vaccinium darrowii]
MKMKASSMFIALFLISSLFSQLANSQTNSCSNNLTAVNAQFPFDISSLTCNAVWSAQNYILRYKQASSDVWSFVLSAPNTNGYIAMGFSPDGNMVLSSAVVAWVGSGGGIRQYYLKEQVANQVFADQGNLTLVTNTASVFLVDSTIYMSYQLSTNSPGTRVIYSVGPSSFFPSAPNYWLTQHTNQVSTTMNYVTGQTQTLKAPYSNLRKNHGILNMLGWGILIPIGAIIARYFKDWDPFWFYAHISVQSLGFILGVAGVSCGFVLKHKLSVIVSKHEGIGIFILVLGCLQMMAVLARPQKGSKYRTYWNWYHYTMGRLLILFAAVNIFYGIHLGKAGRGWDAGYAIVLAGLVLSAIVLEIRTRDIQRTEGRRKKKKKSEKEERESKKQSGIHISRRIPVSPLHKLISPDLILP